MQQEPTPQESNSPPSPESSSAAAAVATATAVGPEPSPQPAPTAATAAAAAAHPMPQHPPQTHPEQPGHEHHTHHQRFDDPFDDRNVYIPLEKALESKASRRRKRMRFLIGLLIVAPSLIVLSIALVKNDREPEQPRWKWMAGAAALAAVAGTAFITRPDPKNMPEL
jgi:hypothetical protein